LSLIVSMAISASIARAQAPAADRELNQIFWDDDNGRADPALRVGGKTRLNQQLDRIAQLITRGWIVEVFDLSERGQQRTLIREQVLRGEAAQREIRAFVSFDPSENVVDFVQNERSTWAWWNLETSRDGFVFSVDQPDVQRENMQLPQDRRRRGNQVVLRRRRTPGAAAGSRAPLSSQIRIIRIVAPPAARSVQTLPRN
jgi:hypothetical protein